MLRREALQELGTGEDGTDTDLADKLPPSLVSLLVLSYSILLPVAQERCDESVRMYV